MKQLTLHNSHYQYLEKSFSEWLDILGYASSTVYTLPIHLREFFHYLEQAKVPHLTKVTPEHLQTHLANLSQRSNQRRGGGLSNNSLNKHYQALEKFSEYLQKNGGKRLPLSSLERYRVAHGNVSIFTPEEIQSLYTAADQHPENGMKDYEALAARDKAMLCVFYSCGLRRNEGYHLNLSDVDFDRQHVHVRKGKNYKERIVPFAKHIQHYLVQYRYDYRPRFYGSKDTEAFFVSSKGKRMNGQSLSIRLKLLAYRSPLIDPAEQHVTLHNLRHSIATHFLQAGMSLEKISRFLGHSSLESTQLYTHLLTNHSA